MASTLSWVCGTPKRDKPASRSHLAGAENGCIFQDMDLLKINACLPGRLHSFSRRVLDLYLEGNLPTSEFRRWFHMPNSDYLPASDCIAQLVDPNYVPEDQLPASVTLKTPKPI